MQRKIYLKSPIRLFLTFIVVISLSMFFMLLFQGTASGNNIPKYSTIVVSKGDTLWSIAKLYNFDSQDIRSKIDEIKELNKISSNIKIGQELKIKIN
jgi:hypothetical protein